MAKGYTCPACGHDSSRKLRGFANLRQCKNRQCEAMYSGFSNRTPRGPKPSEHRRRIPVVTFSTPSGKGPSFLERHARRERDRGAWILSAATEGDPTSGVDGGPGVKA